MNFLDLADDCRPLIPYGLQPRLTRDKFRLRPKQHTKGAGRGQREIENRDREIARKNREAIVTRRREFSSRIHAAFWRLTTVAQMARGETGTPAILN